MFTNKYRKTQKMLNKKIKFSEFLIIDVGYKYAFRFLGIKIDYNMAL